MTGRYALFPSQVEFVDENRRLTPAANKALNHVAKLFGGEAGYLPPSFSYTPVGGTAYGILYLDATGQAVSSGVLNDGQILIGDTGSNPVVANITGTANRVSVTNGPGSITLSLPQDIHGGASPTFAGLSISGLTVNGLAYVGASNALSSTAAATNGQVLIGRTGNTPLAATLTGTANQISVLNGAGTITLSTPQSIGTASDPTFNSLTLANGFGCNGASPQTEYTVNSAISATAGAAYTAIEQTLINDLKALVNQLRAALVANGITV